jgi:hypothetical protein
MKHSPFSTRTMMWQFLLGFAIVLTIAPLQGADFGWHLKIGELVWNTKTTLPVDLFSYTEFGRPWFYKDMVADTLLYLVHRGGGAFGLWVLKFVALLVIASYFVRFFTRQGTPLPAYFAIVAFLMAAIKYRVLERPLLFSLVFFALQLLYLESLRLRPNITSRRAVLAALLPLLLLQWLWICLHRGALLGYVMLAGWAMGLFFAYIFREKSWSLAIFGTAPSLPMLQGACLLVPLSLLVGLLNPSGHYVFTTSLGVLGSEVIRQSISEWQSISFGTFVLDFPMAAALCMSATFGWLLVFFSRLRLNDKRGAICLWSGLALLLFLVLTVRSIRWIPYLSMVSALLLGHVLHFAWPTFGAWQARLSKPLAIIAFGCGFLVLTTAQRIEPWQIAPSQAILPIGATHFATRHKLDGNVLHPFRFGGYLIWKRWPKNRVAIDGRNDLVYPPKHFMTLLKTQSDPKVFRRIQRTFHVKWVMASNHLGFRSHRFLAKHPDWAMVYWSEAAVIYVQKKHYPHLLYLTYRWIHPLSVDGSIFQTIRQHRKNPRVLRELHQELQRMLRSSPRGLRSHLGMVMYYHLLGPTYRAKRDEWGRLLHDIAGHKPAVRQFFQQLKMQP